MGRYTRIGLVEISAFCADVSRDFDIRAEGRKFSAVCLCCFRFACRPSGSAPLKPGGVAHRRTSIWGITYDVKNLYLNRLCKVIVIVRNPSPPPWRWNACAGNYSSKFAFGERLALLNGDAMLGVKI